MAPETSPLPPNGFSGAPLAACPLHRLLVGELSRSGHGADAPEVEAEPVSSNALLGSPSPTIDSDPAEATRRSKNEVDTECGDEYAEEKA
jgi:hypothetical protein